METDFLLKVSNANRQSGGTMRILIYCCVLVILTLISSPITAEAFSRRTHHSEIGPSQPGPSQAGQHHGESGTPGGNIQTLNRTPQAVPEPPVLLLMGIGIGFFAIGSMIVRFRGQDASRKNAQ